MPNTFEKSIAKKGLAGNSPHKTLDLVSHTKRTKVDKNALENGEYQANELTRDFRLNKKTKSKIKMNDVFDTKDKKVLESGVCKSPPLTKDGIKVYQYKDPTPKKNNINLFNT